MKSYILRKKVKIGMFVISLLFTTACKKEFLNVTPNHFLTETSFYHTEDDFIQAVNAVYGDLQKYILDAHYFQEGRSDNTTYDNYLDQGQLGGHRELGFMDQFLMDSDASIASDAWNTIFEAIKDCNVPLFYLKEASIDPDLVKRLEGELRFIRAYLYFVAVRYWGDVPLLLKPITTSEEAFALTRAPKDEVYKAIIEDAEFAESALPESYKGKDKGRITNGAAKMLLAKIFMTKKDYANAEKKLREIVNLHVYSLVSDYAAIFDPANKNSSGSIFEVQFKEGSEGESSNFIYQFAPVGSGGTILTGPGTGGGRNLPTLDMVSAYEPNDLRKDISIGWMTRNGDTVYYVKKYDHDTDPDFARTPDDWPVYRYADVLLMLAEAINEQGYQTGEPFDLLNQIRNRAGLSPLTPVDLPDQAAFRRALSHERRVEFAFENHRWFYLLRTGTAIEVMTAYGKKEVAHPTTPPPDFLPYDANSFVLTPDKLLFPIPADELNKDPNIKQNPGY